MGKVQREVAIPTNAKDLRIKHFKSMALAPQNGFRKATEVMYFLTAFTGLRYNQLLDFKESDIKKMAGTALAAISKLDLISVLPKEITLLDVTYYLVQPKEMGIGWHIDFNACSIERDPVRLACMFYLQKGYNYSDVDDNGNIKYPIDSRYKIFEEHFPLDLFIRAAGFFLSKSIRLISKSMVLENQKTRTSISLAVKVLNPLNGKRPLKQSWIRLTSRGTRLLNSITKRLRTGVDT